MSEEAASPSLGDAVGSVTPDVVTPDVAPVEPTSTPEPDAGSVTALNRDSLLNMIPEDIRGETVFQNINAENPIEDLSRQFVHAQKMVGIDKLPAPKEDWTSEQWGEFYDKIGRPKEVDQYPVPDTSDIGFSLDETALTEFKQLAHESGLTSDQFQKALEFHNRYYGESMQKAEAAQKAAVEEGLQGLRQEWGDNWDVNIQTAEKAFTAIQDESLKSLIAESPVFRNHPGVIKLFHQMGQEAAEEAVRTGDNSNPAVIQSQDQALAALKRFEADNASILFAKPENLSHMDKAKKAQAIERRAKLYQMAYPE